MEVKFIPETAEICGAIIGDGWMEQRGNALYITGHKSEDKDYYDNHLGPLFSKNFIYVKPRNYPYWSVYGIHSYKKEVIDSIVNLGIQKGKKVYTTKFPEWIFNSNELMIAGLRGLFDTDGCFNCQKCYGKYDNKFRKKYHCQPRVLITSTSKKLIYQSFEILMSLGLHPTKVEMREKGVICGKKCERSYTIKINRLNEIHKWFDVFNLSSNPKHVTKYLVWKKF